MKDSSAMVSFFLSCKELLSVDDFCLLCYILWQNWFHRNSVFHVHPCIPLANIVPWCKSCFDEFSAAKFREPLQRVPRLVCWLPPDFGCFKVNTDAALNPLHGRTSFGAVI
ncbi:hypothetical protein ACOSP7_009567 [Xanthoceras sorbifolium]